MIADCGFIRPSIRETTTPKEKWPKDLETFRPFNFVVANLQIIKSGHFEIRNPQSAIRNPQSLLLLRGLRGFGVFEEFVDSILIDFDLTLLFVPLAGGLNERVVGQVLTFAEDALANSLALLREF